MKTAIAAAALGAVLALGAISSSCATLHPDPAKFAQCMADSGKGAAFINAVNDILDGDNRVEVLEHLAIVVGPDVLKCALEQIATRKAVAPGPAGDARAKRAREYLDSHGGNGGAQSSQGLQKKGGGGLADLAARVGAGPSEGPATEESTAAPGADDPGVLRNVWRLRERTPAADVVVEARTVLEI